MNEPEDKGSETRNIGEAGVDAGRLALAVAALVASTGAAATSVPAAVQFASSRPALQMMLDELALRRGIPHDANSSPLLAGKNFENYARNFENYARNFENYARNFENYARNFENYARNFENYGRMFENPLIEGRSGAPRRSHGEEFLPRLPNGSPVPDSVDALLTDLGAERRVIRVIPG